MKNIIDLQSNIFITQGTAEKRRLWAENHDLKYLDLQQLIDFFSINDHYHDLANDKVFDFLKNQLHLGFRLCLGMDSFQKTLINKLIKVSDCFLLKSFVYNIEDNEMILSGQKRPTWEIIQKSPEKNLDRFNGITAIGDIHGNAESLKKALHWANSRNNFIVFLGDIVDYGDQNYECINMVYREIVNGDGLLCMGNHEHKIFRWLKETQIKDNTKSTINLSKGNLKTVDEYNSLDLENKMLFRNKFLFLINQSVYRWRYRNVQFTHGACHPDSWSTFDTNSDIKYMCLYGQVDKKAVSEDNYPVRIYDWVSQIPKNHYAVVGHDVRNKNFPLVHNGFNGGFAVFTDTGSSKGGHLSGVDIHFDDSLFLKISNCTVYD